MPSVASHTHHAQHSTIGCRQDRQARRLNRTSLAGQAIRAKSGAQPLRGICSRGRRVGASSRVPPGKHPTAAQLKLKRRDVRRRPEQAPAAEPPSETPPSAAQTGGTSPAGNSSDNDNDNSNNNNNINNNNKRALPGRCGVRGRTRAGAAAACPTPHQLTAAAATLHRDCSCKPRAHLRLRRTYSVPPGGRATLANGRPSAAAGDAARSSGVVGDASGISNGLPRTGLPARCRLRTRVSLQLQQVSSTGVAAVSHD